MNFKPHRGSAYDESSGIKIPYPRMLPVERDDGRVGVEYQYIFLRNNERIGAAGISGTKETTNKGSIRNELYTIEITDETTFDRIFRLKLIVEDGGSKFEFIEKISEGLIAVFTNNKDKFFSQHYIALTTREALDRNGVDTPHDIRTSTNGAIILAELHIPTDPMADLPA